MYNVYFQPSIGRRRKIGVVKGRMTDKERVDSALDTIVSFCNEKNYKPPYIRMWMEEINGKDCTVIDVGSHSEFFHVAPAFKCNLA